jgi:hypothetical protein
MGSATPAVGFLHQPSTSVGTDASVVCHRLVLHGGTAACSEVHRLKAGGSYPAPAPRQYALRFLDGYSSPLVSIVEALGRLRAAPGPQRE